MTTHQRKLMASLAVLLFCSSSVLAERLAVGNAAISVTLDTNDGTISVSDKRIGFTWQQKVAAKGETASASQTPDGISLTWQPAGVGSNILVKLRLDGDKPEFTLELSAEGERKASLDFPHPFVTEPGTYLIVPMNEGISYPVEDETINTMRLVAYGGHGICMPFWGATDGERGHMAIIETPDDASIQIKRLDGTLCVAPSWDPQRGRFGYSRKLRYVFLDKGGYVAICKRYRAYAKETGLLKTLEEKRKENPNVDLLIGAVNVWSWEKDALSLVREMKALGIERILWSNRASPEVIEAMNQMEGVLTSRYDIYQDLMDPQIVKDKLRGVHQDWTQAGWPQDIMLDEKGKPRPGWQVKGKDGQMYPCGVLCDKQALKYAQERVPAELKTHPYRCRFIDTTTASPWRECFHPDHPMTRSESRHWKMELLRYMSQTMKLVTGSETGHDAAVPYVHYFEGMLSLGPYRVPDAGRNMSQILEEVPERVARFQVGHKYRLPLWELVYHDCVVAQWYWGDYNNKLPAIWRKRDLFNILYGTAPMFMFPVRGPQDNRQVWGQYKDRFAQSYKDICPITRAVGYAEMTGHRFLPRESSDGGGGRSAQGFSLTGRADRDIQETTFSVQRSAFGGSQNAPRRTPHDVTITVNFGEKPYRLPDGKSIEPMSYHVEGMQN